jgi:hypothetical protein
MEFANRKRLERWRVRRTGTKNQNLSRKYQGESGCDEREDREREYEEMAHEDGNNEDAEENNE